MSDPVYLRVVEHLEAGRRLPPNTLTLVGDDGALPVNMALACSDFAPGDLVELKLVRREGKAGERARVLTREGRPLAQPVPDDYRAQVQLPADVDPFDSE